MNKRKIGTEKERMAADFLKHNGYEILEWNYQNRYGEIDLIAKKEEYLVFVEVKYRRKITQGLPQESVDFRKQKKICLMADDYCRKNLIPPDTNFRFDVVSILGEQVTIFENAFEYCGYR